MRHHILAGALQQQLTFRSEQAPQRGLSELGMVGPVVPQHDVKPTNLPLSPKRINVLCLGTVAEASQRGLWTGHTREALSPAPGATWWRCRRAGYDFHSSTALAGACILNSCIPAVPNTLLFGVCVFNRAPHKPSLITLPALKDAQHPGTHVSVTAHSPKVAQPSLWDRHDAANPKPA